MSKINLPPISIFFKFLSLLTTDRGILEHCVFSTPDLKEGYCLDDNSRALQVCLRWPDFPETEKLSQIYLKFILSARTENGFHNDLDQSFEWKNDSGVHESFGRAMAALGELSVNQVNEESQATGAFIFDKMSSLVNLKISIRTAAQLLIGFSQRLFFEKKFPSVAKIVNERKKLEKKHFPNPMKFNETKLKELANFLIDVYKKNRDKKWHWFENQISYDNGRLPLSLLHAYTVTQSNNFLTTGIESLDFLIENLYNKQGDVFIFPGNRGWFTRNGARSIFGQQPIEAGSTVEACVLAYEVTKKEEYKELAQKAFEWYLGKNILKIPLINENTGGIYDGLEEWGINRNQGAESILSFLIALGEIKKLNLWKLE